MANATSVLNLPISATSTTLVVQDASNFPSKAFLISIAQEIIYVTSVAGNKFTVVRGYNNSQSIPHNAGSVISCTVAATLNPVVVNLTDASTVAINCSLGNYFRLSTGSSRVLGNPSNPVDGAYYQIDVYNSSGGDITPTTDTLWNFGTLVTSLAAITTLTTNSILIQYNAISGLFDVRAQDTGH